MSDDLEAAMERAKNLAVAAAGGPAPLARKLGISRSAVAMWKIVPPLRAPKVEEITGISRHVLRPDFWPWPEPGLQSRRQAGTEAA